jgi:hypothetical protein
MTQNRRIRSPRGLFGALALLLLIFAMLPLSSFLAGFLPGGGRLPAVEPDGGSDGTLRVTVVGADHRDPVEGARILVERLTGGEAQAESDALGQVVLEGLGPGPVRVEASVNGHKAETWADPSVDPEVYLAVAEDPKRTGTVRYADGTPADALVLLLNGNGQELAAARTDEEGRYEVADDADAAASGSRAVSRAQARVCSRSMDACRRPKATVSFRCAPAGWWRRTVRSGGGCRPTRAPGDSTTGGRSASPAAS